MKTSNRLNAEIIPMPMENPPLHITELHPGNQPCAVGYHFFYKGKEFMAAQGQSNGTTSTEMCNITLNSLMKYCNEANPKCAAVIFLCQANTTKTKRREKFYQMLNGAPSGSAIMIMIDDIKKCEPAVELLKFTKSTPFNIVE